MGSRKEKRRQFDRAFKQEAVRLSQQVGRTVAEVAGNPEDQREHGALAAANRCYRHAPGVTVPCNT